MSTLRVQPLSPASKSNGWKEVGGDTGAVDGRRGGCVGEATRAADEDNGVQNRSAIGVSLGEWEMEDAEAARMVRFVGETSLFPLGSVILGAPSSPPSSSRKDGDSIDKSSCGGNNDTID